MAKDIDLEYYTQQEMVEILGYKNLNVLKSKHSLYKKQNKLNVLPKKTKLGNKSVYFKSDFDDWLNSRKNNNK